MFRTVSILAAVAAATALSAAAEPNPPPPVVPALRQWTGAEGTFSAKAAEIVVDAACREKLAGAAEQFRADLESAGLGRRAVRFAAAAQPGHFFLTAANDAALGPEGYRLEIADAAVLCADTAAGAVTGTRTLLQMLALGKGACVLPRGTATDFPACRRRMLLLDVGRKPFPTPALRDVIRLMAWYKMNELHLHLNDEAFGNGYSGFRVQCDTFPGLTSKDQSYTKKEIRELQAFARALNVTITPEIDMPGHSQCFTRIWPELAYKGQKNYLDVNNPETVRRLKKVLDEMIPLFDAPDFHIGTDEYRVKASAAEKAKLADDFMRFVNTMAAHVRSKGKVCRMWYGTDHRESKVAPDSAITLDIWNLHAGVAGIARGHKYINSNENVSYIVPGCHYYGVNNAGVYQNWEPWLFGSGPDEETRRDPNLLGAKLHIWNDQGPTGYTVTEIADLSLPSIQVFAEKMWGAKGSPDYTAFQKRAAGTLPVPGVTVFDRLPAGRDGLVLDLPKEQVLAGAASCIPLPLADAPRADLEYPWTLTVELRRGADTGRRGVILSSALAEVCADFQPGDCPGGKAGKHQADHGQANAPSSLSCFSPWPSLVFSIFEILEILAQALESLLIVFAIAIFQKFMIATVHGGNFSGVLDRAPILFRPGGYFLHIGNQPVEIAAIDTVNLFDGV
jgi:hexosaminidase